MKIGELVKIKNFKYGKIPHFRKPYEQFQKWVNEKNKIGKIEFEGEEEGIHYYIINGDKFEKKELQQPSKNDIKNYITNQVVDKL